MRLAAYRVGVRGAGHELPRHGARRLPAAAVSRQVRDRAPIFSASISAPPGSRRCCSRSDGSNGALRHRRSLPQHATSRLERAGPGRLVGGHGAAPSERVLAESGVDPGADRRARHLRPDARRHPARCARARCCGPASSGTTSAAAPSATRSREQVGFDTLLLWVGNPALAGFTAPKLLWVRDARAGVWQPHRHRPAAQGLPQLPAHRRAVHRGLRRVRHAPLRRRASPVVASRCSRRSTSPADLLPPVHASTASWGTSPRRPRRRPDCVRERRSWRAARTTPAPPWHGRGAARPGPGQSRHLGHACRARRIEPRVDPAGRLHTFCHAVPDTWYLMGVVLSAGGSLRWFRDTLADPERRGPLAEGTRPLRGHSWRKRAASPPGCEGLLFLPYLTGERTPHGDPDARGVLLRALASPHPRAHGSQRGRGRHLRARRTPPI